jgi:tetratricopeptide (TPR) repeat protein
VCPACGTRIKAGRQHCLRCFAALPDSEEPRRPPIWESLGLSQSQQTVAAVGVVVLVLLLVVVVWSTWPEPAGEEAMPPTQSRQSTAPAAAPSTASGPGDQAARGAAVRPTVNDATPPALTQAEIKDLEAMRKGYEEALAKTPDDAETLNNLGQALARLARPEEALVQFQRAVALAPSHAVYHFNLARAAAELGRHPLAIQEFREAARLLPNDPATRYTLGVALQRNNDHTAALPQLERAVALAPNDARPHLAYAVSLDQLKRTADAIKQYRAYVEMQPTAPDAEGVRERIRSLGAGQP